MNVIETGTIVLPSVVRVHKMANLEKNMIDEIMGKINETVLRKVKVLYISIVDNQHLNSNT